MVECSILIPAYNAEKYLSRALDSVLNQTYKDFEIILIDDGSTDSTPQICDEYGEKYSFIHVFHQKNIGLSKTREKLIEKASGKYIFWLDADDYYDLTLLEKAVKAFEITDADIVVWGAVELTKTGDNIWDPMQELGIELWRKRALWGLSAEVWLYASRKELWDEWERFPDDVDLVDDVWITPQIVSNCRAIAPLGECLYFYDRTNTESITNTHTAKNFCRTALACYRTLKRNMMIYPNEVPLLLDVTMKLLVNAYCVNLVHPCLTTHQIELIKYATKDLHRLYPSRKVKKFYLVQLCMLYGIDFICHWYGRNRIRKFEQKNK